MNISQLDEIKKAVFAAFNGSMPDEAPLIDPGTETEEVTGPLWGKSWNELDYEYFDYENLLFSFIPDQFFPYFLGFALQSSIDHRFSGPECLNIFFDFWVDLDPELLEPEDRENLAKVTEQLRGVFSVQQKIVLKNFVECRASYLPPDYNEGAESFVKAVCI